MIIFNSILIFSIFILSLGELIATRTPEEVEEDRCKCLVEISALFPVDDILENAKIAFDNIKRLDERTCYDTRDYKVYIGHAFAYYSWFKDFLRNDSVPRSESVCTKYEDLTRVLCRHILVQAYAFSRNFVLIKGFYDLDRDSLDTVFNNCKQKILTEAYEQEQYKPGTAEKFVESLSALTNVVMEYWEILISSFSIHTVSELNATRPPEEVLEDRRKCISEISALFANDDIRENAKIAFAYLTRVKENDNLVCYDSRNQAYHNGHAFIYYSLFQYFLKSDLTPPPGSVCIVYMQIMNGADDLCKLIMMRAFGMSPLKAIIKAFYDFDRDSLDKLYENEKGHLLRQLSSPVNINILNLFPNLIMNYWVKIIKTFKVHIDDGTTGMPTKARYCELEYPMH